MVCAAVPEKYLTSNLNLKFSRNKSGTETQKFVSSLLRMNGPYLILIETVNGEIFGMFVDVNSKGKAEFCESETCLFMLKPEGLRFLHVKGRMLTIRIDGSGFCAMDDQK